MKQRELKKQKESQLRAMEDARQRYPQIAPQQKSQAQPQRHSRPAPVLTDQQKKSKPSSAFAGYEAPPLRDDSQPSASRITLSVRQERGSGQQQQQQQRVAAASSSPPSQQQSLPPEGHPFNSTPVCCGGGCGFVVMVTLAYKHAQTLSLPVFGFHLVSSLYKCFLL